MASTGGDITEVTYNHPTLGSGRFLPKAGEDSEYDLGGFRTADPPGIAGGGEAIYQMNQGPWFFSVPIANDVKNREDVEQMVALSGDVDEADWTFTCRNGSVYGGKGKIVGDIKLNMNAATVPLKVAGGGGLAQIA
jgi:hypothetical protein